MNEVRWCWYCHCGCNGYKPCKEPSEAEELYKEHQRLRGCLGPPMIVRLISDKHPDEAEYRSELRRRSTAPKDEWVKKKALKANEERMSRWLKKKGW